MESEFIETIEKLNGDFKRFFERLSTEASVEMTRFTERLNALNDEVNEEMGMNISINMTPDQFEAAYNASVDTLDRIEKLFDNVKQREDDLNTDDYRMFGDAWDVVSEKNRATLVLLDRIERQKREEFDAKQSKIDENNKQIEKCYKENEDIDRMISRHERAIERLEAELKFIENAKYHEHSEAEKEDLRADIEHHKARLESLRNAKQHNEEEVQRLTKENEEIYRNFNDWDYRFQRQITEAKKAEYEKQQQEEAEDRKKRDEERRRLIRSQAQKEAWERRKKKQEEDNKKKQEEDDDDKKQEHETEKLIDIKPRPKDIDDKLKGMDDDMDDEKDDEKDDDKTKKPDPIIPQPKPEPKPTPVGPTEPVQTTPQPKPEPTPTPTPVVEGTVIQRATPKNKLLRGIGVVLFGAAAFLSAIGLNRIADKVGLLADKINPNNTIENNININTTVETSATEAATEEDELNPGDEIIPSDDETQEVVAPTTDGTPEAETPTTDSGSDSEQQTEPEKESETDYVHLGEGDIFTEDKGTSIKVEVDSNGQKYTHEQHSDGTVSITNNGVVEHENETINGESYIKISASQDAETQNKVKGVNYSDFEGTEAEKANAAAALISGRASDEVSPELFNPVSHDVATQEIDEALQGHSLFH